MQNKGNKQNSEKSVESNEESSSCDSKKESSCDEITESTNLDANIKTISDEQLQNDEEKRTNEKKKKRKSKKKADENESEKRTDNTSKAETEEQERNFLGDRSSPPERNYDRSQPQVRDMFTQSGVTPYSNWMVSPTKSNITDPLSIASRGATPSLNSASPSSTKSPSWGSDIGNSHRSLNPSQRLMQESQDVTSLQRRQSSSIASESYRDYGAMHFNPHADEYPSNNLQESNVFGQNCQQRNSVLTSYSSPTQSHQFSYKPPYSEVDRSHHVRPKHGKGSFHSYDGMNRYQNSSSNTGSTSSAASVMAAVYMNSRNPGVHYNPQYANRISPNQLPQRGYSNYEGTQSQSYPNELSGHYNCSNPLTL